MTRVMYADGKEIQRAEGTFPGLRPAQFLKTILTPIHDLVIVEIWEGPASGAIGSDLIEVILEKEIGQICYGFHGPSGDISNFVPQYFPFPKEEKISAAILVDTKAELDTILNVINAIPEMPKDKKVKIRNGHLRIAFTAKHFDPFVEELFVQCINAIASYIDNDEDSYSVLSLYGLGEKRDQVRSFTFHLPLIRLLEKYKMHIDVNF